MPIFDYKCEKCGATFEKLVSHADEKVTCGKCGSKKVEKQLSAFSASVSEKSASSSCATSSCCPTGSCCSNGMCGL